jgi:hypothetical protein
MIFTLEFGEFYEPVPYPEDDIEVVDDSVAEPTAS